MNAVDLDAELCIDRMKLFLQIYHAYALSCYKCVLVVILHQSVV